MAHISKDAGNVYQIHLLYHMMELIVIHALSNIVQDATTPLEQQALWISITLRGQASLNPP